MNPIFGMQLRRSNHNSFSGGAEAEGGLRDHYEAASSQCWAKISDPDAQNDTGATSDICNVLNCVLQLVRCFSKLDEIIWLLFSCQGKCIFPHIFLRIHDRWKKALVLGLKASALESKGQASALERLTWLSRNTRTSQKWSRTGCPLHSTQVKALLKVTHFCKKKSWLQKQFQNQPCMKLFSNYNRRRWKAASQAQFTNTSPGQFTAPSVRLRLIFTSLVAVSLTSRGSWELEFKPRNMKLTIFLKPNPQMCLPFPFCNFVFN